MQFGPGAGSTGRTEGFTQMKAKQLLFTMVAAAAVLAVGSDQALSAKGPAGPANAPSASSGASVVGRAKFTGQLPQPAHVSMNSDPSCAKLHPGPAVSQDFVTGGDNSLGNVIVFIS